MLGSVTSVCLEGAYAHYHPEVVDVLFWAVLLEWRGAEVGRIVCASSALRRKRGKDTGKDTAKIPLASRFVPKGGAVSSLRDNKIIQDLIRLELEIQGVRFNV